MSGPAQTRHGPGRATASTADVIVRGGEPADVAIADGRIVAVGPELPGPAREEIDARGLHVLPGAIDAHVHLNEPGTDWEGFATGTRALAAGGVTCAVDMPLNAHPPTVDGAAFDAKRACGERAARIDFALWGGIVPGQDPGALEELADRGVVGFKAFMSDSGMDDFPRADDLTLYEGMRRAAALDLPVAVHAESEDITAALAARARAAGRTAMRDYLASRPAIAETEAIARALLLAEEAGCALHIVHVSTGRGVALVAEAGARGVDASCETCPHYLALTGEDAERLGAVAKCAPPLRDAAEVEALWRALADGRLPMVASDHSPCPPALKGIGPAAPDRAAAGDAFAAWGGISGAQTMVPLTLGDGLRRGVPLSRLTEALAGFPARRLGLSRKGRLEPGADADLALVQLDVAHEVGELLHRHPHSPFAGRTLHARVVRTLVRGRTPTEGHGRLVTPDRQERP
jgi:allantoinase